MEKKKGDNEVQSTLQVEEGNRLIAEFMGGYLRDRMGTQVWDHEEWDSPLVGGRYALADLLKYHSSWDWLMPVVEKIFLMRKFVLDFVIQPGKAEIILKTGHVLKSPVLPQNESITEVWLVIVKFIQWYNKKKHNVYDTDNKAR